MTESVVEVITEQEADAFAIWRSIDLDAADHLFTKVEMIYTLEPQRS